MGLSLSEAADGSAMGAGGNGAKISSIGPVGPADSSVNLLILAPFGAGGISIVAAL
jgi:hypothetical protein